jgi:uncharacterized protein involved in exopolysaccharide biosynthesis
MTTSDSPSLIEFVLRIVNNDLKHIKLCTIIVVVPTLITFVAVMWLIKPTYSATAIVTPPASTSSIGNLSSMLGGDMSSYASLLGLSSGSNDADAIWTFFNSWELHDQVITKFNLAEHYEFDGNFHADLLKEFRRNFSLTLTKEDMLEVTIEDEDYKLAAHMVQFILVQADSMYNAFKTAQARQSREYFEDRIAKCLVTLDSLEDDFVNFQVKNNFYDPSIQMESTIKYLGEQEAQREAVDVELNYERMNRGVDSKKYEELQKRYRSLDASLSRTLSGKRESLGLVALKKSPALGAEYMRKESEIKVQETMYKMLRQQSEQLLLEEAKTMKNLHVLQAPWENDKKVAPLRSVMLFFVVALSCFFATILSNFLAFIDGEKSKNSAVIKEWNRFWNFFHKTTV